MTPLSKEIFDHYQVRKTKKQKDAFIQLLKQHYPDLKVQEGGFSKSRNLILGDVEHAEFIFTAHYDTCPRLPFPNFITPKNPLLYIGYAILITVPIILTVFILSALVRFLTDDFLINYFATLFIYFGVFSFLLAGPANKHTANDNTSGVITLCELYDRLTPEERTRTAIVFFDNEESGLFGSRLFKKMYQKQMRNKLLINFDCVSDGDNILIASSKTARSKWNIEKHFTTSGAKVPMLEKAECVFYPSDQLGFPNTVAVAALKHNRLLGYYMDRIHTAKDTVFDEANIEYLCTGMHALVHESTPVSNITV